MTRVSIRNLLESVRARKLTYFGHIMRKKSESLENTYVAFGEADNARNNTEILHKRQTENNMDGQHFSMDWIHIGH